MNRELGALREHLWHCIPCWARVSGQDASILNRIARSLGLEKLKETYEVMEREPPVPGAPVPEVMCDIMGPNCEKASPTKYNGWNLSVRPKPEPE